MLNSQRIFVDAVKKYCAAHGIAIEMRSQGWLIIMQRGARRHLAFGYDLGLNSAVAHRIANDKAATADVLQFAGVRLHSAHAVPEPEAERVRFAAALMGGDAALLRRTSGRHRRQAQRGHQRRFRLQGVDRAGARARRAPDFFFQPRSCDFALLEIENEVRVVLLDHRSARRLRQEPAFGHGRRQAFAAGAGAGGDASRTALDGVAGHARRSRSRPRSMRSCRRASGGC